MSAEPQSPARSKRLLAARIAALTGIVGLGVAAFVPLNGSDFSSSPVCAFFQQDFFSDAGRSQGLWTLFMAFVFPPILLVCWGLGLILRKDWVRSALGWAASILCFAIFLAVSVEIWRVAGGEMLKSLRSISGDSALMALIATWFVLTCAATLASLSLSAAPVRFRLAGVVAVAGTWCALYFTLFLVAIGTFGGSGEGGGYFALPLGASLLIAAGGIAETLLLWRGPSRLSVPSLPPRLRRIASSAKARLAGPPSVVLAGLAAFIIALHFPQVDYLSSGTPLDLLDKIDWISTWPEWSFMGVAWLLVPLLIPFYLAHLALRPGRLEGAMGRSACILAAFVLGYVAFVMWARATVYLTEFQDPYVRKCVARIVLAAAASLGSLALGFVRSRACMPACLALAATWCAGSLFYLVAFAEDSRSHAAVWWALPSLAAVILGAAWETQRLRRAGDSAEEKS